MKAQGNYHLVYDLPIVSAPIASLTKASNKIINIVNSTKYVGCI